MTAQEAIERLHNLQSIKEDDLSAYIGVWYKGIKDDYDEAIDMAIEALQRGLENVNADSCSEKPNRSEPLTDKEQRIFLAAMGRERKVCKQVDKEWRDCREPYEDSLVSVCNEIERKVKGALWET